MPRKARVKSATGIYHVSTRNRSAGYFHEADDYQKYLETVKKLSLASEVSILGYCLMTNHVHLY